MRRKRDSNPRYTFGAHTLSRRASSTTRASLQILGKTALQKRVQITKNYAITHHNMSAFLQNLRLNIKF